MRSAALVLCGLWLLGALGWRLASLAALARTLGRAHEPAATPPRGAIVLLRPLHGAPPQLAGCLESGWRAAERAGARVVAGAASETDPAIAIAAAVRARFPEVGSELRVAPGPRGANRKIANLVQMDAGGHEPLLALVDADVAGPPDFLERLAAPLADPAVGLATCPYRSVPAPGVASRVDALITNAWFLPSTCLAVALEGLHFGLGAMMAVRRDALAAAGGLEALLDEPADDYRLARNVERAGFRLAWVPLVVLHHLEREGWRRMLGRHVRWAGILRSVRGRGYLGLVFTYAMLPAVLLGALVGSWPGALVALLLGWSLAALGLFSVRAALELRPLDLALLPVAETLGLAAWLAGFARRPSPP